MTDGLSVEFEEKKGNGKLGRLRTEVEKEKRERVTACAQALGRLLDEYDCILIPEVTILGGQVSSTVKLMAR